MANAAPLFGEEALGRYDEMLDRNGRGASALAAARRGVRRDGARRIPASHRLGDAHGARKRRHVQRVRRSGGSRRGCGSSTSRRSSSAPTIGPRSKRRSRSARGSANAILHDIYGEQRLLRDGIVPRATRARSSAVSARAARRRRRPDGVHVHLYSVDLARAADGSWTVHASRADAPTGLGYALENRVVVSQTFPELFGELGVQRLATFFRHYRDAVVGLARGTSRPRRAAHARPVQRSVLRTRLSRALSRPRTRRGRRSLGARRRRLSAHARRTRARLGHLPAARFRLRRSARTARRFGPRRARTRRSDSRRATSSWRTRSAAASSNRPRSMPICRTRRARCSAKNCCSATSRPCGAERHGAAPRGSRALRRGIVRNAFDAGPLFSRGSSARLGSELTRRAAARHSPTRSNAAPATLVVQDLVPLGVAPTFERGAFTSRPMTLRVFAAWTPNGYVVMPGGLARIAADDTVRALSMQSGAASKDVWALARGPVDTFSLLRPPTARVEIRRSGNEAPSRAMDNLFWLARYAERTEGLIRVLRAVVLRLAGDTGSSTTMSAALLAQRLLVPLELVDARSDRRERSPATTRTLRERSRRRHLRQGRHRLATSAAARRAHGVGGARPALARHVARDLCADHARRTRRRGRRRSTARARSRISTC